jgi:hypothetical protein
MGYLYLYGKAIEAVKDVEAIDAENKRTNEQQNKRIKNAELFKNSDFTSEGSLFLVQLVAEEILTFSLTDFVEFFYQCVFFLLGFSFLLTK